MSINEWVDEYLVKSSRILIVDDEPAISDVIVSALDGYRCECVAVQTGEEALQHIRDAKFDLIFLDIKLPGINGVQTLRAIKKIAPEIPVVIMTGYFSGLLLDEAANLGIVSFLRKPHDFTPEFIQQIFKLFKLRGDSKPTIFAQHADGDATTALGLSC